MPRCTSCSAPLPADTNRCSYCGTRNDVDFMNGIRYSVDQPLSERICPHCDQPLATINLSVDSTFLIEHCSRCYGLFFDPGEIEALLDSTVSKVFIINYRQLANLAEERSHDNKNVRYIKCPVCRKFMNRINFGYRSGVVVDQCKSHGIWLDSGEITHLLEWKKSGGQLLAQQKKVDESKRPFPSTTGSPMHYSSLPHQTDEHELLSTVASAIFKLFR